MAQEAESYLSVVMENHDQPRSLSKWFAKEEIGYETAALLAVMNLTLRGIPFIYQGEEIGMENIHFDDIHQYEDVMMWGQYQRAKQEGCTEEECLDMANRRSRDHARTPMQWDDSENAGFTTGIPWFPVNPNYKKINAKTQENGKSILNFYRELTAFRKSEEWKDVLVYGSLEPVLEKEKNVIAYKRSLDGKELLVLLNFVNRPQ